MKFNIFRTSFFNNSARRGFTLVELLIVISIIAILTGIIVTSLTASKSKSRDSQRVSDINQIQLALEQYFDRCGQYPTSLDTSQGCAAGVTFGSYISVVPKDPSTGNVYDYLINTNQTDYVLHALLENKNIAPQQNSYSNDVLSTFLSVNSVSAPSWHCYDSTSYQSDYCISTK
ncbi:MAG TPA: type II secretion system protein [Candidatus Paceibacterota bacterium]|jgi:general secretion pathway protein G|nr:type II secretion system protein [Candidatus Paceibacterota bacterium]